MTLELKTLDKFRLVEKLFDSPVSRWQLTGSLYMVETSEDGTHCYDVDDLLNSRIKVIEDRYIATLMYLRASTVLRGDSGEPLLTEAERAEIRS